MRLKVAILAALAILAWLGLKTAVGQVNPNCTEFGVQIPTVCCCTNNCCAEAKEGEFQHISGDQYRSTVTGQLVMRSGWSPDGRFIRCACDQIEGVWTWHPKAYVRCIFPPIPSS